LTLHVLFQVITERCGFPVTFSTFTIEQIFSIITHIKKTQYMKLVYLLVLA